MIFSDFPNVAVVRVVDGDTIVVDLGEEYPAVFREMSVRINGIDSPEMKAARKCEKKDAVESKEEVTRFLGEGTVDLYFCTGDKFYRLLCTVISKNRDTAEHMLAAGYANNYAGGTKIKWGCK